MKKSLLFLSFLLFISFLSFAAGEPNLMLDADGEGLRTGVEYYIVSAIWGAGGGGVYPSIVPPRFCPPAVFQSPSDLNLGHPAMFFPVTEEGVIRVSTDLNIVFTGLSAYCRQLYVWKRGYDEELGRNFIVTNGVVGNPGCETIDNWFKIEVANPVIRSYKLVFCPTVCNTTKVICQDVGRFADKIGTRLTLTDDAPFEVVFMNATSVKNRNILKSVTST